MCLVLMSVFGKFRSFFAAFTRQKLEAAWLRLRSPSRLSFQAVGPSCSSLEIHLQAFLID
jgi:hypothetical protein